MTGTVTGLSTHKSVPVIFEPPCTMTVNTCAQLTPQKHGNQIVCERATQQSYSHSLAGARVHAKTNITCTIN